MDPSPEAKPPGLLIGYARVSTEDQDLSLQLDALVKAGVSEGRIYREHASGAAEDRPAFIAAVKALRAGDTLVVWKLDRLGRSLLEVLEVCQRLEAKGAGLRVITEKIDTTSAMGRFVLHILAALAEMERELIRERTVAGLKAAKARGKVGGRRPWKMDAEKEQRAIDMLRAGHDVPAVAEAIGVSASLIYQRARGVWAARIAEGGGK